MSATPADSNAELSALGEVCATALADLDRCLHCGTSLGELGGNEGSHRGFCCEGCRVVHGLLQREGLDRYYELRGGAGERVVLPEARGRDHKWLEPLEAQVGDLEQPTDVDVLRLSFDIQGLHCSACVWLIDQLFGRRSGAVSVLINPALGKITAFVRRGFELRAFVADVERFGYVLGPSRKSDDGGSASLLLRMGLCIAIAMNAMILAIAVYAGLPIGPLHSLFGVLGFALATASVAIGGSLFIASAASGLRRGILHLDLPIALGIVLAYGGSSWAFLVGRPDYFDTLDTFIALMLVGRFLQERVLARNRRYLLEADGIEGILARRVVPEGSVSSGGGQVELVPCTELKTGDCLLVAPLDLVPVEAVLADGGASHPDQETSGVEFSLDWINGESRPRRFAPGERIPAGSFSASASAVMVHALEPFSASTLLGLLRSPPREDGRGRTAFWRQFPRWYVGAVLSIAALGFVIHVWMSDVQTALDVVVALLIVTCPCAFGIAAPLATELTLNRLRREGVYVRTPGLLDRATTVRRVVFDKTGTLTTGRLSVGNPQVLASLDDEHRAVLFDMVVRSNHPKSAAVVRALEAGWPGLSIRAGRQPVEHPGRGLELVTAAGTYRLGTSEWVALTSSGDTGSPGDLVFGVDGRMLCALSIDETLRPHAGAEVAALTRLGLSVWVLSGDSPARVAELAASIGIPVARAIGGQSPEDKARWLQEHDRDDTMILGDGINDSLAVASAWCSGTPAIDRPFMAARSDFYVTTQGLDAVRRVLLAARRIQGTIRFLLGMALVYNSLTIGLSLAGRMSPLLCAVLMPVSSLTTLLAGVALTRRIAGLPSALGQPRSAPFGLLGPTCSDIGGNNRWK